MFVRAQCDNRYQIEPKTVLYIRGHRIYIIYIVLKYMYIASKWTCEKDNYYSKKKTELVSC